MSNRTLGLGMVAIGLLMVVVGVASLGGDSPNDVATATTTAAPASTTAAPASTTTAAPTTTSTPTTTTTTSTTTTTAPPPSIEDFIVAYAAATESGDTGFLTDRLLPDLRTIFGEELCRNWVETEILALRAYQLTGEVSGPFARTLNVGDTAISVEQYYEAPVSFTFQGQSFDTVATFVVADGQVYWIGECR